MIVRGAMGLPRRAQALLAGRPVEVDGERLDPEVQLLLRLERYSRYPPLEKLSPPQARITTDREALVACGPRIELHEVRDLRLAGAAVPLSARLYVPAAAARPSPLIVHLHGGGWVVGSLTSHDSFCRLLARETGFRVLAAEYRLAPEHFFPAGLEDVVALFADAASRAGELGADPSAIAISGDSAGGNLAATASLRLARAGGPVPAFQLLIYPVTDVSRKSRSYELFREGYFLTEATMDWYREHYLSGGADPADPEISPLLAADVSAAPPTHLVTCGFDVLRDEGEAYAERLRAAGVAVTQVREAGLIHAFINAVGVSRVSREAVGRAARRVRAALSR